jgi:hypothetical protein
MYKLHDVSTGLIPSDKIVPVDCGTCPVSMACAVEEQTWSAVRCCNLVAIHGHVTGNAILVDCARNKFSTGNLVNVVDTVKCSLCSGLAVDIDKNNRDTSDTYLYEITWIPTIYANHDVAKRVEVLTSRQAVVSTQRADDAARKAKLRGALLGKLK